MGLGLGDGMDVDVLNGHRGGVELAMAPGGHEAVGGGPVLLGGALRAGAEEAPEETEEHCDMEYGEGWRFEVGVKERCSIHYQRL